jgi:hypothetical protein
MVKFSSLLALSVALSASAEDITPHLGAVEVFGLHKLSSEKIRNSIGANPGDPLPPREDTERKVETMPGVVASSVRAICCDQQKMILYIGIEEKNAPHVDFHAAPSGGVSLPQDVVDKYESLVDAIGASMRAGNADEDLTSGYSLMADPDARTLQQALIPLVEANLSTVDQVLRQSADTAQRAIAAFVLQYGPRSPRTTRTITDGLQYALQDPDPDVRKNAMTALKAVMVGARLHPEQQIHVEPTWFVELMNSVFWEDRRNASLALVTLTEKREPETLALIRERALPAVLEMARWHDLQHALPGFILAGRLAGMDDKAIQDAWVAGSSLLRMVGPPFLI